MTDTDRQSIREGRDTYAAIVPRPSRFANEGRDYRAWADRADAWAKASKGDADAAATLPLSDWAEARRDLMTPQTVATNHALHAQDAETQHECVVCSESVAQEGDTCSEHDDWIGCGQCGDLHPSEEIYLSPKDGTFCESCLHNARRSGWGG